MAKVCPRQQEGWQQGAVMLSRGKRKSLYKCTWQNTEYRELSEDRRNYRLSRPDPHGLALIWWWDSLNCHHTSFMEMAPDFLPPLLQTVGGWLETDKYTEEYILQFIAKKFMTLEQNANPDCTVGHFISSEALSPAKLVLMRDTANKPLSTGSASCSPLPWHPLSHPYFWPGYGSNQI